MLGLNLWTAVVLLVMVHQVYGWGQEGHIATCKIAEGYLTKAAAAGVQKLLPASAEGNFSSVCPWADTQRFRYYWSRALHYINTPDVCTYTYCRDCHDATRLQRPDRCVTGAIYNFTMQLKNGVNSKSFRSSHNLTEALMFLAHYMGDVHQPLHVGFLGDEGGNGIELRWYKQKSNLHHVWDDLIIETAMKNYYDRDLTTMVQSIQDYITDDGYDDISSWDTCDEIVCPEPFASESIDLACEYAYRNATAGVTLGDDYFESRLPIVEKRLAQGGIRLANVLNRIFDPSLPTDDQSHPTCDPSLPLAAE